MTDQQQPVRRTCGRKTEVYSRVVGYFRPVSEFNIGKEQEFKDRTPFDVKSETRPYPDPKERKQ